MFAWQNPKALPSQMYGLLANSVSFFADTGGVSPYHTGRKEQPFSMTNIGLNITLEMDEDRKYVILPCSPGDGLPGLVTLAVQSLERWSGQYARTDFSSLGFIAATGSPEALFFPQNTASVA